MVSAVDGLRFADVMVLAGGGRLGVSGRSVSESLSEGLSEVSEW